MARQYWVSQSRALRALLMAMSFFHGAGQVFDDIGGVSGDAGRHDPIVYVLGGRQAQVLAGGDVAEEVCPGAGGYGAADGAGDVIVAGGDVRNQRTEHVEGRAMAEAFLQLDVGLDLVEGDMARPFDHDLDAGVPGALGEFAEDDQFVDLGAVGGVSQTTGAETVTQGQSGVVGLDQFQQAVVVLVKGVFRLVVGHPGDGEGTAARDDFHDASFVVHALHGGAGYAAVYGDKVDAVIEVFFDAVENLVGGHVDDRLALFHHRVAGGLVQGHAADTGLGLGDDGASDFVDGARRWKDP